MEKLLEKGIPLRKCIASGEYEREYGSMEGSGMKRGMMKADAKPSGNPMSKPKTMNVVSY